MKRKNFIILYLSIGLLGIFVLYYAAIPYLLTSNFFQKILKTEIKKKTGFETVISDLGVKANVFPLGYDIKTKNILLENKEYDEYVKIDEFNAKIDLCPLLVGNISLRDGFLGSTEINIIKDYSERLTSPRLLKKLKHFRIKNFKAPKICAIVSGQRLIDDFVVDIADTQINDLKLFKRISIDTDVALTDKFGLGVISFNSDIKFPLNYNNIKKSFIKANINNVQLQTISKLVNKYYDEIEGIEGNVSAIIEHGGEYYTGVNITSDKLFVSFKDSKPPIFQTKPLNFKSNFLFDDNKIDVKYTKISSELLKAGFHGEIDLTNKKNIKNKLTVVIDESQISEFINLLPPLKDAIEEVDLCALKKNVVAGNILGHLNINGSLLEPNIVGNILVSDLYAVRPIKNAQKAKVKLLFNGDNMTMDTFVPTAPRESVSAKGIFNLYGDKRCVLKVKSTENIDLETAQTVVNPLQDVIKLYFGPVPVMKIKGIGNIDINISGNRVDSNIIGAFNFRNGTASFNDLPNVVVKNIEGRLLFRGADTFFETKNATLDSQSVNISGICDLYGKFDFNAHTKAQNLAVLFNEIKNAPMLGNLNIYFDKLSHVKGIGDINLQIYGNLKDVHDMELNKNTFIDTDLTLYSAGAKIKDMPVEVSNIFGNIQLKKENLLLDLYALINKSKVYINGHIKGDNANIAVNANAFRLIDLTILLPANIQRPMLTFIKSEDFLNFLPLLYTNFNLKYIGGIKNINYNNIDLNGKLMSSDKRFKDVVYTLNRSNFKFTDMNLNIGGVNMDAFGTITNAFSPKRLISGKFSLKDFDLDKINTDTLKELFSDNTNIQMPDAMSGLVNVSLQSQNNNINGKCNFEGVRVEINKKISEILSAEINVKNNTLHAEKVNARIFEMPVLLDGYLNMVNCRPSYYNFDIKAKPVQDFLDETYNRSALYPIKVKGNISVNTKISGNTGRTDVKSELSLDKDSSIYYLGATIGDKSDEVKINSDIAFLPHEIRINDINYNKIVPALNENKNIIPILTLNGSINSNKDNVLRFNNLKIKSLLPVDAKIFNIIFRKSFVKEGVFTSDLILNGTSIKPEILGKLDITSVKLPFFESNINNINVDFTPRYINIKSNGDLVTNEIVLDARLRNNFSLPFVVEDVKIHLAELDLNEILNKFKNIEENIFKMHNEIVTYQPLDYTNFIINNSTLTADRIVIDKIVAKNFESNVEIDKDKVLNVKNFKFNMADGSVNGNITHNYDDNNLNIALNLNQADASNIAETLFNLKNQIYGLANGQINLSCNFENEKVCLSTLSGEGYFEIQNGKMPKLGSLEYLLKAGNLINNGITGLTINSLIDLLSPLKSGEFKNIKGDFSIADGVADDINIYSNGKDLNIYISGNYDLSTSIADFKIFGSLSKEVTTLINKVKNLSLNTLLKTIPIAKREKENEFANEISKIPMSNEVNNIYKFFRVIINGNINESGFVKTFEWID